MLECLKIAKKGKGFVFSSGEHKINPISGLDIAEICVIAAFSDDRELREGGEDIFTHTKILKTAYKALNKKVNNFKITIRMQNILRSFTGTLTSIKICGPLQFFMTVLTIDKAASTSGKHHLNDFFSENRD